MSLKGSRSIFASAPKSNASGRPTRPIGNLSEYAKVMKLVVVDTYLDDGVLGTKPVEERPEGSDFWRTRRRANSTPCSSTSSTGSDERFSSSWKRTTSLRTSEPPRGHRHLNAPRGFAFQTLASVCEFCGVKVIWHGVEADGSFYCFAHCASMAGAEGVSDRA